MCSSDLDSHANHSPSVSNRGVQIDKKQSIYNRLIPFGQGIIRIKPVYGKYLDFEGTNGIILKNLLTGRQYAFSAVGRNNAQNLTSWSKAKYIGLKGILLNVSNDISVNLLSTPNISPVTSENGQYGKHMLRVMSQNYKIGRAHV